MKGSRGAFQAKEARRATLAGPWCPAGTIPAKAGIILMKHVVWNADFANASQVDMLFDLTQQNYISRAFAGRKGTNVWLNMTSV